MTQGRQEVMVGKCWSVMGAPDEGHLKPYQFRPCDERISLRDDDGQETGSAICGAVGLS
jgi:hypothetical protein